MKQKKILIIIATAFFVVVFGARVDIVDKKIDIMSKSISVNLISNKTAAVTMHTFKTSHAIAVSKNSMPLEKHLLKAYENQAYRNNSMPLSPMPAENSARSSPDDNSGLFSFEKSDDFNNNQAWGWVANEVNSVDNYRDIRPRKDLSENIFQSRDSGSPSGYNRESFFDNTLYGSDKRNNSSDAYSPINFSPKDSKSSPYSAMSW